ncbi:putative DNA-binding transcriptional regulator YafY [Anaerosolibacter carboniphilus]|uniref:Putative DNA-binding transcriptional regulator YafY n=1 Tax=Anaerosolibacter carboniphilus TaxID=1417629 RepID=A0A841KLY4_9FIRM|nr:YafY family protein [Anaerosolibacter carboniphilus]MBB6214413.1 putative DNA-binding transcriptional regulator YafY [Anaerosolibacter carboniphilus]
MKLERLLAIVIKLLNKERVTAKELADYFEVSVRTIQRDIEAINMAGIPVFAYKGQNGGYGVLEDYVISKSYFTKTEQSLLLTALQGVYKAYDDKNLQDIMDKLSAVKRKDHPIKTNNVLMDFSPWGDSVKRREKVNIIRRAIEENKIIKINYLDLNGKATWREVEPMALILKVNIWYLHGYCHLRQDYRLFKLTRIRELQVTDHGFMRREGPVMYDFDHDKREKIKLILKFEQEALSRLDQYFELEGLDIQGDGSVYVTVKYPEDEWVYGMILSFGDKVEVIEPERIRRIILERTKNILKKYE